MGVPPFFLAMVRPVVAISGIPIPVLQLSDWLRRG